MKKATGNSRKQATRWSKMEEVSPRIAAMRRRLLETIPELCSDRARLVTESYGNTFGRPMIERRAKALAHVLQEMDICIVPGELIVGGMAGKSRGCQVYPEYDMEFVVNELDSFYDRIADRFYVSAKTKEELQVIHHAWKDNSLSEVALDLFPDDAKEAVGDLIFVLTALRSGVGHMIIDYEKILSRGLEWCIEDARKRILSLSGSEPDYTDKVVYYQSVVLVCRAAIDYSHRYAKLAQKEALEENDLTRKRELLHIAEICSNVPAREARNFHEALQSFWFIHLILHIESNGHSISPGRFDQYMYPYFQASCQEEDIDESRMEELIHCLWLKFFELNKVRDKVSSIAFGGYPMFQNLIVGGQTAEGKGAVNPLSHLCLDATVKVGLSQPSLSVRWYYGCPDDFFRHVMETISYGTGMPALFNDEILIPNMLQLGYSLEQARNYAIVGCTETTVPANTEPWLTGGFINLLKVLELVIWNGYDPLTKKKFNIPELPETYKDYTEFEIFYAHYFKAIRWFLRQLIICDNILDRLHGTLCPTPFESAFIEGCMDSGKTTLEGGAKYNFSTLEAVGIANVADSLAAIKKLVFEEQRITWKQLLHSLKNNFGGKEGEIIRLLLVNGAPKYGNDQEFVDSLGARLLNDLRQEVALYQNPREGNYQIALYSIATHVLFSNYTGATPDGRRHGDVLADGGVSCEHGLDTRGLTALLKSVVRLDPYKATGSTLLNVKLNPVVLSGENLQKTMDVVKTFFLMKGQHVQFNVIDVETLRKAQKHPELFPALTVRVAGFSVLFSTIDPLLQEDIIRRTEHVSG